MSDDLFVARKAVRSAITLVTETLRQSELHAWREELAHLNAVAESLTERLNARAIRQEVRPWVQCTTVSNECLGGCRSQVEHLYYRGSRP